MPNGLDKKEIKNLKKLSAMVEKTEQEVQSAEKYPTPQREKYWNELSLEEKVERMRINVKNFQSLTNSVNNLRDEIDMLFEHTHEADGKLVIKVTKEQRHRLKTNMGGIGSSLGMLTPMKANQDETYF